ncbi:GerMN domain-containing protein, partial [Spirochaetota bacterium]
EAGSLKKEMKRIKRSASLEDTIFITLEELITGPISYKLKNIFPIEGRIQGIFTQDERVYINLSREFILFINAENEKHIILSLLETIAYNFKSMREVVLLFNNRRMHHISGAYVLERPFTIRK